MPIPDFRTLDKADGNGQSSGNASLALVVEDDRRMADLMEKVLKRDGWEVRVARNGFDAGFLASSLLPGLILLDIMLPGIDGREACRQMRSDPRLSKTKILAVTALRDPKSVNEIFEAGVDAYLAKPFDISHLRTEVERLTGKNGKSGAAALSLKDSTGTSDEL
jgi:DNA-binding response OmpR family regulator